MGVFELDLRLVISFLARERVSICDFVMKFVDKMISCQFGNWKQVLIANDDNYARMMMIIMMMMVIMTKKNMIILMTIIIMMIIMMMIIIQRCINICINV